MTLYLHNAATTVPGRAALKRMNSVLEDAWGNASSIHGVGRRARRAVEQARDEVAGAINADPKEIVFTSGATLSFVAARNLLGGTAQAMPGKALLTSRVEHNAVLGAAQAVQAGGAPVRWLEPDDSGEISLAAVESALAGDVGLVALMLVNNETGIRTRIREAAELAHRAGALFFCDAVQGFGYEQLDVRELGVDALALSAHKAYGPKGVGVLWLREGLALEPVIRGGEQERGLRPGTHDTVSIAGMGAAAAWAADHAPRHGSEIGELRDRFEELVAGFDGVTINGRSAPRGPKHSSVTVADVDGEALLMSLDAAGVCASSGSACSAGSTQASHVLTAMGLSPREAKATVRFSFGAGLDTGMVENAARIFAECIERCRAFAAPATD